MPTKIGNFYLSENQQNKKPSLRLVFWQGGTRFVSAQGAEIVKAMHLCIVLERQTQPMRKTIRCRRECCVENRFSAKQKTKLMLGLLAGHYQHYSNKKIRLSLSLMSVGIILFMAGGTRFEHATGGFGDRCSTVEPPP